MQRLGGRLRSTGMDDPFDLDRFVTAQSRTWDTALAELVAGAKRGHWMWFIFPQIAGLGRSDMARFYAIGSIAEARAYLAHPLLGSRLVAATRALSNHRTIDAARMLGAVDAIKLRSSLTLFAAAGGGEPFETALQIFYRGCRDPETLRLLTSSEPTIG